MPLLALLKMLEKNVDVRNIGWVLALTYKKHLILLSMIFFYQNLNITVYLVL